MLKLLSRLILAPLAKSPEYCFFTYLLGMVAAVCTVNFRWHQELYPQAWGELLLWVYASAAIIALLPRVARQVVRPLLYIILYSVSVADVFCFVRFETTLNPSILMLMAETDSREAGEFFTAYLSTDIIASNVGWLMLVLVLHVGWTLHRRLRRPRRLADFEDRAKELIVRIRPAWAVLTVVALVWAAVASADNLSRLHFLMTRQNLGDVEHRLTEKHHGEQFLPMYRLAFSVYANRLAAKQIDVLRAEAGEVRVDSCQYTTPDIVLIIGEAYCKRHSQLYGYDRPTTPRQLALARRGTLVPFTDVVTPWNLTSFVFKHVMSTYAVGDPGAWCDYPLFGEVFRRAGYHVTFLTNEFLYTAKQQVYDFSGGFFLNDPKLSAAQFDERNTRLHVFDEGLLDDYRAITDERARRGDTLSRGRLTIFHLIGQHQDYRIRCPNSRKRFTTADYPERTDLTNPRWLRNLCNYDNATLYNDSVVTEMLRLFKDSDAVVLYMPDHGEEVHSRELPHFSGRMHSTTIVPRLAREEFEIPFWVWGSPTFRTRHAALWREIKAARRRPYMTDALPHLLFHLAGISCPYYRQDLDILSPKYNARRPRVLKHQADYDSIMGRKPAIKQ